MSNDERARLLRQRPDCELCGRRPSAAVDHDAVTGRVRGPLCRSCNRWLGSMETALRVPRRQMQMQGGVSALAVRGRRHGRAGLAPGGTVLSGPEREGVRGRPAPGPPSAVGPVRVLDR
ncbi:endonuclease domain-containing protein [Streptomyces sp. NPDC101062]|uniref:endonuclease domain-containing protein n=1 Tax=unclassified Streptomyces TaxID=2593676 RepID=UPI00381A414B